jgi:hypothetical protein
MYGRWSYEVYTGPDNVPAREFDAGMRDTLVMLS